MSVNTAGDGAAESPPDLCAAPSAPASSFNRSQPHASPSRGPSPRSAALSSPLPPPARPRPAARGASVFSSSCLPPLHASASSPPRCLVGVASSNRVPSRAWRAAAAEGLSAPLVPLPEAATRAPEKTASVPASERVVAERSAADRPRVLGEESADARKAESGRSLGERRGGPRTTLRSLSVSWLRRPRRLLGLIWQCLLYSSRLFISSPASFRSSSPQSEGFTLPSASAAAPGPASGDEDDLGKAAAFLKAFDAERRRHPSAPSILRALHAASLLSPAYLLGVLRLLEVILAALLPLFLKRLVASVEAPLPGASPDGWQGTSLAHASSSTLRSPEGCCESPPASGSACRSAHIAAACAPAATGAASPLATPLSSALGDAFHDPAALASAGDPGVAAWSAAASFPPLLASLFALFTGEATAEPSSGGSHVVVRPRTEDDEFLEARMRHILLLALGMVVCSLAHVALGVYVGQKMRRVAVDIKVALLAAAFRVVVSPEGGEGYARRRDTNFRPQLTRKRWESDADWCRIQNGEGESRGRKSRGHTPDGPDTTPRPSWRGGATPRFMGFGAETRDRSHDDNRQRLGPEREARNGHGRRATAGEGRERRRRSRAEEQGTLVDGESTPQSGLNPKPFGVGGPFADLEDRARAREHTDEENELAGRASSGVGSQRQRSGVERPGPASWDAGQSADPPEASLPLHWARGAERRGKEGAAASSVDEAAASDVVPADLRQAEPMRHEASGGRWLARSPRSDATPFDQPGSGGKAPGAFAPWAPREDAEASPGTAPSTILVGSSQQPRSPLSPACQERHAIPGRSSRVAASGPAPSPSLSPRPSLTLCHSAPLLSVASSSLFLSASYFPSLSAGSSSLRARVRGAIENAASRALRRTATVMGGLNTAARDVANSAVATAAAATAQFVGAERSKKGRRLRRRERRGACGKQTNRGSGTAAGDDEAAAGEGSDEDGPSSEAGDLSGVDSDTDDSSGDEEDDAASLATVFSWADEEEGGGVDGAETSSCDPPVNFSLSRTLARHASAVKSSSLASPTWPAPLQMDRGGPAPGLPLARPMYMEPTEGTRQRRRSSGDIAAVAAAAAAATIAAFRSSSRLAPTTDDQALGSKRRSLDDRGTGSATARGAWDKAGAAVAPAPWSSAWQQTSVDVPWPADVPVPCESFSHGAGERRGRTAGDGPRRPITVTRADVQGTTPTDCGWRSICRPSTASGSAPAARRCASAPSLPPGLYDLTTVSFPQQTGALWSPDTASSSEPSKARLWTSATRQQASCTRRKEARWREEGTSRSTSSGKQKRQRGPRSGVVPVELTTLLSVDGERIQGGLCTLHEAWATPLTLAMTLYLIYFQIPKAFLPGLIVFGICLLLQVHLTGYLRHLTRRLMVCRDARLHACREFFAHFRHVKLLCLERFAYRRLRTLRQHELQRLKWRYYLHACGNYFFICTPLVVKVVVLFSLVLARQKLTAASDIFSSLALIDRALNALNMLPLLLAEFTTAAVSFTRLSTFLSAHCRDADCAPSASLPSTRHGGQRRRDSRESTTLARLRLQRPRLQHAQAAGPGDEERRRERDAGEVGEKRREAAMAEAGATDVETRDRQGAFGDFTQESKAKKAVHIVAPMPAVEGARGHADGLSSPQTSAWLQPPTWGAGEDRRDPAILLQGCYFSWQSLTPSELSEFSRVLRVPLAFPIASTRSGTASSRCSSPLSTASPCPPAAGAPAFVGAPLLSSVAGPSVSRSKVVLKHIDLRVNSGDLTVIVGPSGGGKSSLLCALLGELVLIHGSAFLPTQGGRQHRRCRAREDGEDIRAMGISSEKENGRESDCDRRTQAGTRLWTPAGEGDEGENEASDNEEERAQLKDGGWVAGYAAQQPWLFGGTIRENILFGREFEPEAYHKVLTACALHSDIDKLACKDLTRLDSGGQCLSGGQRARVGLARAVYGAALAASSPAPFSSPLRASVPPSALSLYRPAAPSSVVASSQLSASPPSSAVGGCPAGSADGLTHGSDLQKQPRTRRLPTPAPYASRRVQKNAETRLFLIDDPFSSLDAVTAMWVWRHIFAEGGILWKHTVVLVTQAAFLSSVPDAPIASLLYMEGGHLVSLRPAPSVFSSSPLVGSPAIWPFACASQPFPPAFASPPFSASAHSAPHAGGASAPAGPRGVLGLGDLSSETPNHDSESGAQRHESLSSLAAASSRGGAPPLRQGRLGGAPQGAGAGPRAPKPRSVGGRADTPATAGSGSLTRGELSTSATVLSEPVDGKGTSSSGERSSSNGSLLRASFPRVSSFSSEAAAPSRARLGAHADCPAAEAKPQATAPSCVSQWPAAPRRRSIRETTEEDIVEDAAGGGETPESHGCRDSRRERDLQSGVEGATRLSSSALHSYAAKARTGDSPRTCLEGGLCRPHRGRQNEEEARAWLAEGPEVPSRSTAFGSRMRGAPETKICRMREGRHRSATKEKEKPPHAGVSDRALWGVYIRAAGAGRVIGVLTACMLHAYGSAFCDYWVKCWTTNRLPFLIPLPLLTCFVSLTTSASSPPPSASLPFPAAAASSLPESVASFFTSLSSSLRSVLPFSLSFSLSPLFSAAEDSEAGTVLTADDEQKWRDFSFLCVYLFVVCFSIVLCVCTTFGYVRCGLTAARALHERVLSSLLRSSSSWVERTPLGRILSRCSDDIFSVDEQIPSALHLFTVIAVTLSAKLLMLAGNAPLLLLVLLPVGVFFWRTSARFRSSIKDLKRLEMLTRSPLHEKLAEASTGSATIRAFGAQNRFYKNCVAKLGEHRRVVQNNQLLQAWLSLRLQGSGALAQGAFLFIVVCPVVLVPQRLRTMQGELAAVLALGLYSTMPLVRLLTSLITSAIRAEMQMVAVERLCEYANIPPEDPSYDLLCCRAGASTLPHFNSTPPVPLTLKDPKSLSALPSSCASVSCPPPPASASAATPSSSRAPSSFDRPGKAPPRSGTSPPSSPTCRRLALPFACGSPSTASPRSVAESPGFAATQFVLPFLSREASCPNLQSLGATGPCRDVLRGAAEPQALSAPYAASPPPSGCGLASLEAEAGSDSGALQSVEPPVARAAGDGPPDSEDELRSEERSAGGAVKVEGVPAVSVSIPAAEPRVSAPFAAFLASSSPSAAALLAVPASRAAQAATEQTLVLQNTSASASVSFASSLTSSALSASPTSSFASCSSSTSAQQQLGSDCSEGGHGGAPSGPDASAAAGTGAQADGQRPRRQQAATSREDTLADDTATCFTPQPSASRARKTLSSTRATLRKLTFDMGLPTQPPIAWPTAGRIDFDDVCVEYGPGLAPALSHVTFTIFPGETVAVVGRTGAGKSSLLLALARMVNYTGSIKIDGVDTRRVPRHILRSRLALVPQSPILFSGSLRSNLDAERLRTPEQIFKILDMCKLANVVLSLPDGLDTRISARGECAAVEFRIKRSRRSSTGSRYLQQSLGPATALSSPLSPAPAKPPVVPAPPVAHDYAPRRLSLSASSSTDSGASPMPPTAGNCCEFGSFTVAGSEAWPVESAVSSEKRASKATGDYDRGEGNSRRGKGVEGSRNDDVLPGTIRLSPGQQQLLCFCRALLRGAPIMCLDEVNSRFDSEVDEDIISNALQTKLRPCTVLMISHKMEPLRTLCDRVIAFYASRVVEIGEPSTLLDNPNSYFYKLYHAGDAAAEACPSPTAASSSSKTF